MSQIGNFNFFKTNSSKENEKLNKIPQSITFQPNQTKDKTSISLNKPLELLLLSSNKSNTANSNFSFIDDNKEQSNGIERLKKITPNEFKHLGQHNKKEFFKTLLPAALESEKKYGVPAAVTLAQAALESGWGKKGIGHYNIFGIKGSGNDGTVSVKTKEFSKGKTITINAKFAKYDNYYDAVSAHGKVYQGDYSGYKKGLEQYAKNKDPFEFIKNVASTYCTSPQYTKDISIIMKKYDLVNLAKEN